VDNSPTLRPFGMSTKPLSNVLILTPMKDAARFLNA
jgi:hypothetical protein